MGYNVINNVKHTKGAMNPSKTIACCLHELIVNESLDDAFEKITEWLPQSLGVSSCFIFKNHLNKKTDVSFASLEHWWKEGIRDKSKINHSCLHNIDVTQYPEIFETLSQKEIFTVSIDLALHPALEQLLVNTNLKTFILAPIFYEEQLWGSIGLGHCTEKNWETSDITILHSLAAAIGIQLVSNDLRHKLYERTNIYEETLISLNELIWEFDIERKNLKVLGASKDLGISGNSEGSFNVLQVIQDYVHPLDRGRLIRSYVTLLQSNSKTTTEEKFRIYSNLQEEYKWVKAHIVVLTDAAGKASVVTGTLADVTEVIKAKSAFENQKQEREFLVDKINQAVFSIDGKSTWASLSNTWQEITGYKPEDCTGKPVFDFFSKEYLPELKEKYNALMNESETEIDITVKLTHQSGKRIWVRLLARAIKNTNGVTGIFGLIDNIHTKYTTEQFIIEKEKRFRFITENISDCIFIIHKQGDFIYLSPASRSVLGYKPQELLNQCVLPFVHPDSREDFIKYILEADVIGDKFTPVRYQFQTSENEYSWLETYARPVVNEQGNINAILCSTRNINERVCLTKEVENALNKEKAINDQHTKFITEASLQTKTSLTALRSNIDILQMYIAVLPDEEKMLFQKQFSKMLSEISAMQQSATDMLLSGRSENLSSELQASPKNKIYQAL